MRQRLHSQQWTPLETAAPASPWWEAAAACCAAAFEMQRVLAWLDQVTAAELDSRPLTQDSETQQLPDQALRLPWLPDQALVA